MKVIRLNLFVLGILTALLAGCFDSITTDPPRQDETQEVIISPFTVDILIGDASEDRARTIAGPDSNRIKAEGANGIRNFIQLIVVTEAGEIAAFDEVRKSSDSQAAANLRIDSIPFGQKYYLLLLMGHWERNYGEGGYAYKEDQRPTLLAAGLHDQLITGSGTR
jgi:hypothetical protein